MPARRSCLAALLLTLALLPACGSTEDEAACDGVLCSAGQCVVQGGQPVCLCGAFEQAAGLQCTVLGLDDRNDGPDVATPVQAAPSAGTATIDAKKSADQDVYRFPVTKGHIYTFTCTPQSLSACAVATFSTAAGARNPGTELPDRSAVGYLRAAADGVGYAAVRAREATALGSYRYALADVGVDDHADVAEEAQLVPTTSVISGRLETPSDRDLFLLDMEEGSYQAFECTPTGGSLLLRFISPSTGSSFGTVLNVSGPFSTSFLAIKGTRHELSIEQPTGAAAGTGYRCETVNLGRDDHGGRLAPTPLADGVLRGEGVFHASDDGDCFTFQLLAAHSYRKRCVSEAVPLCEAGISSPDVESFYALVHPLAAGPVVACASPWARLTTDRHYGPFALELEDLGPDQHAATLEEATPIAPDSAPTAGVLMPRTDVDVFRFEASAGHVYRAGSGGAMQVLTATGQEVPQSFVGLAAEGRIGFEAPADGPLFLRLQGYPRAYQLTLEALGPDDHADAPAGATPLSVGSVADGRLETRHDRDWFAVDLEARPYAASAVPEHGVALYAPDGVNYVERDFQGGWSPRVAGRYYILVFYNAWGENDFQGDERYSFTVSPR